VTGGSGGAVLKEGMVNDEDEEGRQEKKTRVGPISSASFAPLDGVIGGGSCARS
jgi:hypothetical protein